MGIADKNSEVSLMKQAFNEAGVVGGADLDALAVKLVDSGCYVGQESLSNGPVVILLATRDEKWMAEATAAIERESKRLIATSREAFKADTRNLALFLEQAGINGGRIVEKEDALGVNDVAERLYVLGHVRAPSLA